jgi:outer membrane protein
MIKKIALISAISVFALASNSAFAQSLDDAINSALKSEPKFQAMQMGGEMAKARLKNTKANEGFSVGLQGTYGASKADFGMGQMEIYPRALGLAIERRLFDGGQALARIKSEEFSLAATNGEIMNAKNQLIVETAEAYSNYYVATKSLEFAKDNLEASTRFARDAKLQFEAGEIPVSEKSFADAALARARAIYANIEGQKLVAKANLYRLSGLNVEAPTLAGVITKAPSSEIVAQETAKANHPLLAAANARLLQAQAQYKLANAAYMPKITIGAKAQSVRDQFLSGYKSDDYGAYVNFAMPLYTNGRVSSAIEMARSGKEQARLGLDAAQRGILMGVTQAYATYNAAILQKDAAATALGATQNAAKSVEAEMRAGQRPIADVLDARKSLTEAQMQFAKAEAELLVAKYKINAAIGGDF